MTTFKTRLTNFTLVAAAVAAFGLGAMHTTTASAAQVDEPWPEPPTCSNETYTCDSLKAQLDHECYFTDDDWCETDLPAPFEESRPAPTRETTLTTLQPTPPPTAKVLVAR